MITMTLWVGISLAIGYWGKDKELGFWWSFLISLVLSPILGGFFVWISGSSYVETDEEVLIKIEKMNNEKEDV